jgi:hypothetical protein
VYRIGWTATATFKTDQDRDAVGTAQVTVAIDTSRTGPVTTFTPEQIAELKKYQGQAFQQLLAAQPAPSSAPAQPATPPPSQPSPPPKSTQPSPHVMPNKP